jgi:crossover junction endodeoxyribonuclease RuvC
VRIFGIDPGSARTGYGCVESDGSRCRLVCSGVIALPARLAFPDKLLAIHVALAAALAEARPDCVAVESLFHSVNPRSAFALAHARGVILLTAVQAGLSVVEYAPAEVKRAVVGYGRAEKQQVQHMVRLLLGLAEPPAPFDVADALAVAICHAQASTGPLAEAAAATVPFARRARGGQATSWRQVRPGTLERG